MTNTPIVGPDEFLNVPAGTYDASLTSYQFDASGKEYVTSMSRLVPNGPFGVRLWMRIRKGAPWNQIIFKQGCHGILWVINNRLYFVWNQSGGRGAVVNQILNYVPFRK